MRPFCTRTVFAPVDPSADLYLHVEISGPANGPLVILLHGFPDFWYSWRHQLPALAQAGFLAAAPDQRGYNLSGKPSSVDAYNIDRLTADVIGLMDYFGREKAVIVGHDWGAAVAWNLAAVHSDRVERLVIFNVPHQASLHQAFRKPLLRQLLKSWYIGFFQLPRVPETGMSLFGYRGLKAFLLRTARPGAFSTEDLRRYQSAWSQPGALTGGIHWYRAMARYGAALGLRQAQQRFEKRISVPTLVLWGDRDAFLEPELADWSMNWVDQGRCIHFSQATHWLHMEEHRRVNQLLLDFLQD